MDSLELYIDIKALRVLGLTEDEIEGFLGFDWDGIGPVMQKTEETPND